MCAFDSRWPIQSAISRAEKVLRLDALPSIQGVLVMKRVVLLAMCCVLFSALIASAQENRSEISLQGAGWFTNNTSGNGTSYSATDSGGIVGTYRYHLNHWLSAEGAYGYSQSAHKYVLPSDAFRIESGIQQFTGSLVVNLPTKAGSRFNPYFLA